MNECTISNEKGEDYVNWVKLTKRKLKQREYALMSERIATVQRVINEQCALFEKTNSDIKVTVSNCDAMHSDLIAIADDCLNKLYAIISSWNGIDLKRTKKSLTTFRRYFSIAKCWFDQRKKSILAPDIWVKLFTVLEKFGISAANVYFSEPM